MLLELLQQTAPDLMAVTVRAGLERCSACSPGQRRQAAYRLEALGFLKAGVLTPKGKRTAVETALWLQDRAMPKDNP